MEREEFSEIEKNTKENQEATNKQRNKKQMI